tara:strand:+ start:309 stop:701 length:393 start_codon:yes stop_codon:yes gene_type:complete
MERKKLKTLTLIGFLLLTVMSFGQSSDFRKMTKEQAKTILSETLSDSTLHNVIGVIPILTDSTKAVKFAEFVLFDIYGKQNIVSQKPYDIFHLDNYWLISGILPKGYVGGTFLIIIDSRNCQIVRLTHGK